MDSGVCYGLHLNMALRGHERTAKPSGAWNFHLFVIFKKKPKCGLTPQGEGP